LFVFCVQKQNQEMMDFLEAFYRSNVTSAPNIANIAYDAANANSGNVSPKTRRPSTSSPLKGIPSFIIQQQSDNDMSIDTTITGSIDPSGNNANISLIYGALSALSLTDKCALSLSLGANGGGINGINAINTASGSTGDDFEV
jgi:hypothetical protein